MHLQSLIELTPGDVYAPKAVVEPAVCIQIGVGPDCGVFRGECVASTFEMPPEFRVMMNLPSLKRHFRKAGQFPLAPGLSDYAAYGYKPAGSSEQWRTTLDDMEKLVPIPQDEYERLETLAAWEAEHVYARMRTGRLFRSSR